MNLWFNKREGSYSAGGGGSWIRVYVDKIWSDFNERFQRHINAKADRHLAEHIDYDDMQTVKEKINAEVEASQSESTTLRNNINAEITDRRNSDTVLQNNINAEITNRTNAVTTLQNNINVEVANRTNTVTTLQNNINAEITDRKNADTVLQNNIKAELHEEIYDLQIRTEEALADHEQKIKQTTSLIATSEGKTLLRCSPLVTLNNAKFEELVYVDSDKNGDRIVCSAATVTLNDTNTTFNLNVYSREGNYGIIHVIDVGDGTADWQIDVYDTQDALDEAIATTPQKNGDRYYVGYIGNKIGLFNFEEEDFCYLYKNQDEHIIGIKLTNDEMEDVLLDVIKINMSKESLKLFGRDFAHELADLDSGFSGINGKLSQMETRIAALEAPNGSSAAYVKVNA